MVFLQLLQCCNQHFVSDLKFLKYSFWLCDWHIFFNNLTKLFLHKEQPQSPRFSLSPIAIILMVIIQLIASHQLYDKGPCFT